MQTSAKVTKYGIPFPARDLMVAPRALAPLPEGWTSLGAAFVQQARKTPDGLFGRDTSKERVSYREALIRSCVIARHINHKLQGKQAIGIMLPPSVPAALSNFAAILLGKWAVNLNYTTSSEIINSAISQCEIDLVITSRRLVEKQSLSLDCPAVYLEDLVEGIAAEDKLWAMNVALNVPTELLADHLPGMASTLDDVATVMFTSGSTGNPKGVLLAHRNVLSNIQQINNHAQLQAGDSILGILPFFHSFGFTVTLWTVATLGLSVAYHTSPLDSKIVCKLLEEEKLTIMASTPSLMRSYLARATREHFASVRWLLLGSEKLEPKLSLEIKEKLGIEPVEGFGCTEMAPVVAANSPQEVTTPDGRKVHGNKIGSVGQPVAGTALAIVDLTTFEVLPYASGREGLIFAAGPQVMLGYLHRQKETDEVLDGDIYCTGDVGYVDADGNLVIADRLDEFAKVGSEMVPLLKVSDALRSVGGLKEIELRVTSVPDEARGEKLVVLYTHLNGSSADLIKAVSDQNLLPNLWLPKAANFYQIEAFPVGSTGKFDIKAFRKMAREKAAI